MNVWNNSIAPYDPRKSQLVMGNAQLIAVEVTVSKILRKILRMADESIFRLTLIHAASLPLLGGAGGYFAPAKRLGDTNATYAEQFADGAKGIPAVFIGQYVINTAFQGFHMPKISIQDMLITAQQGAFSTSARCHLPQATQAALRQFRCHRRHDSEPGRSLQSENELNEMVVP